MPFLGLLIMILLGISFIVVNIIMLNVEIKKLEESLAKKYHITVEEVREILKRP